MATFAATRATSAGSNQSSATIANGATQTMDFDSKTGGAFLTLVQVSITTPVSASGTCTIQWYGSNTGAAAGLDTESPITRVVAFGASETRKKSILVPWGFTRVAVTNNTGQTISSWTVTGEIVTQTST